MILRATDPHADTQEQQPVATETNGQLGEGSETQPALHPFLPARAASGAGEGGEIPPNQAKNNCCKLSGILRQHRGKLTLTKPISLSSALLPTPPPFPLSHSLRKGAAGNRLGSFSCIFIPAPGSLGAQTILTQCLLFIPAQERGMLHLYERPSSAPNVLASQHAAAASSQWLSGNVTLPKTSALAVHFHTSINFIMVSL